MRLEFNPAPKRTKFIRIKPSVKVRNTFKEDVRRQIKVRDNACCQECGSINAKEIHHVKTRGSGGRGVYTNGLTVCHICHRRIHDKPELLKKWQRVFEDRYGPDYFKDEWD